MSALKSRLVGLAATLSLFLLVGGIPALLVSIDAVPRVSDFAVERLTSPDDGTTAVAVIGVVAWLAWLVISVSVVIELIARVRGVRPPQLPGLAVPQMAAWRLVALAALLFATVPSATQNLSAPAVAAVPLAQAPDPTIGRPHATSVGHPTSATVRPAVEEPSTTAYTVKRGDSLWRIAEQQLGDGRRYDEIVTLNEVVLHGRPDFITPGTVLRIPPDPAPDRDEYVVQPGDTLSEVAETHLGDATAYDQILEASRDATQPNGARLSDPDVIRPGWRLTIPTKDDPAREAPRDDRQPPPQPDPPTTAPAPATPPSAVTPAPDTHGPQSKEVVDEAGTEAPAWVIPGLTGAGALLAGSLLLVLRQHRRTQQRYRRPGHIVAPPPPELRPVEKTAHLIGTSTAPKVDRLDRALRHLAAACSEAPHLQSVELTDHDVTLHLADPTELPGPWIGAGLTWALALNQYPPAASGIVAPYPLLVSVGQSDEGALVLVNLEVLRAVAVSGDPEGATALGRHLAAELVLNPWSTLVEIDTLGFGSELADIDPLRLHHHQADDTTFVAHLADELEAESPSEDPDRFRALLAAAHNGESGVGAVAEVITGRVGRSAAAVVAVGCSRGPDDVEFRVTPTGRLEAATLGLHLMSAGLTADEAAACAAIVDLTRDLDVTGAPTPMPDTSTGEEQPLQDQAGALTTEVTEPRPTGPAGERSLLPSDTATYARETATTTDDVDELAPLTPDSVEKEVAERDPDLDADLAAWSDPDSSLPKLTLLGPVGARASGEAKAIAHRKPFYVELLAYLALHPRGVTTPEVCDAFGLTPARARGDISHVRRWLGPDPRTGALHLPSARARQHNDTRGLPVYQLDGVLTDLDLFRRLRTRGQSRGSVGLADLAAALRLISGEPFTHLRPAGWSWLLDSDRIDHIITCAIVDVAHIVTTHALTTEDFELARFAAETAYGAAPDDETSRLDMIAVAAATGHADLAERHLIEGIFDRTDDDLGPVEVPPRSATVVEQRGWDSPKQRGAS